MSRLFYTKSFFQNLGFKEELFGKIVWKFVYYYNQNQNSFHNFLHGTSVLHSANYFLLSVESLQCLIYGKVINIESQNRYI